MNLLYVSDFRRKYGNQNLIQEKKVAMSSASDWGLFALSPVLSANARTKLFR